MRTIKRVPEQPAGTDLPTRAQVAEGEGLGKLTRGNKALLAAFFLFLVVVVLGSVIHLPYAVMSPGPTQNTLGTSANGKGTPIIAISGLPTYPPTGRCASRRCGSRAARATPSTRGTSSRAWVDPAQEVLPVDQVFDPQVTQQQVAEENAVQMEGSQEEATAVALRAIGKPVPTHIAIVGLTPTSKAKGLLEAGDRLDTHRRPAAAHDPGRPRRAPEEEAR